MLRRDKETTPLLWAHQPQLQGSNSIPRGQPFLNPNFNYQYYSNQSSSTPPENTKKIHRDGDLGKDPHSQFCALTGCPPTNAPPSFKYRLNERTLYGRAVNQVREQNFTYQLTAALTNFLLLLQIVLGAALTGLGGSGVPGYVITLIGATNTVIAGIVAYLKSRGHPMRARMFRDDLERVVDEMENSEVMWLGISKGAHGYDDIDTDVDVTVRSEVARLTRLLDKAIRTNTANNPEMFSTASGDSSGGSTGARQNPFLTLPAVNFDQATLANIPPVPVKDANADADAAPATSSKPKKEQEDQKKEDTKDAVPSVSTPSATPKPEEKKPEDKGKAVSSSSATDKPSVSASAAPKQPPIDPDASPATSITRKKSATNTATSSGSGGNTTTTTYKSSNTSGGGETTSFSSSGFASGLTSGVSNLLGNKSGDDSKPSEGSKNDSRRDNELEDP